ncbi:unnamed protein product [Bursaphelenchus okinawaensis]|uniref:Nucleotide exchange factor Fes1 domain-containing protein n=1 Tax=Bursaphelenchus okinawaensis TaxID=465554 RepID=A0A811KA37_9BILA|nr:unnamed protein product [Bursaphelenchus okinawaensis]CAG9095646.1 unnamed protein product [Bursaphelenchus okinawaensis]
MSKKDQPKVDTGAFGQLLALATTAQGDRETDQSIPPMSEDNRKWLEQAMTDFTKDSDPIKKLKCRIANLKDVDVSKGDSEVKEELVVAVDNLINLVCDIDLALDFCKLDGLNVVMDILSKENDVANISVLPLISEIAQNNPPVQKELLKQNFIEYCIKYLDKTSNNVAKLKAISALSAMVKAFPPAVIKFVKSDGHTKVLETFEAAWNAGDDRLIHRCVITLANIGRSAAPELIQRLHIQPDQFLRLIYDRLNEDPQRYAESIAYLQENPLPAN